MLAVTVLITLFGAHAIDLPPATAAISVLLLTITPHLQALILKGELRIVGLVLAISGACSRFSWSGCFPYFPLFATLLFLGHFVATYLTAMGGKYAYAGLQMGLVFPMIAVAPPSEFGSFTVAVERLAGILLGLLGVDHRGQPLASLSGCRRDAACPATPAPAVVGEINA